jgi:hypothetical protein
MPEEQLKLLFDSSLTTENARERGYQHKTDIPLNERGELEVQLIHDVLRMVKEQGYKVGQPEKPGFPSVPYGLYQPIKKPVQPQKKV